MKSRILIKEGNNENCNHEFKVVCEESHYLIRVIKHKCEWCSRVEEFSVKK